MDVDYEEISNLLNIVDKCAGHSGKLNSISNVAMSELLGINEKIRADAAKRKEAEKARQVKAQPPKFEQEPRPSLTSRQDGDGPEVERKI
jgi:hypothetical protein